MTGRVRNGRRGAGSSAAALLAAALLAAVLLAGCGAGGPAASSPSAAGPAPGEVSTAADGVQEVTLQTQDDYVFTPDSFTVAPGRVRLTVENVAEQLTHNFRFTPDAGPEPIGPEIPLLAPGQSGTIEFEVSAPGEHQFECSFHTQLQQFGTMTVEG
jgi:plastocyanin